MAKTPTKKKTVAKKKTTAKKKPATRAKVTPRVGTLIDKYAKAYANYQKADQAAKALKSTYNEIGEKILAALKKEDLNNATGVTASVKITSMKVPHITDYAKLEKFLYANKALDLFQRRLNTKAFLDRIEARKNRPIPGLKIYEKIGISRPSKRK